MLETMKRNKILTYAFLMAFPMTVGSIFSSCTDDFEKLNTSNIPVSYTHLNEIKYKKYKFLFSNPVMIFVLIMLTDLKRD